MQLVCLCFTDIGLPAKVCMEVITWRPSSSTPTQNTAKSLGLYEEKRISLVEKSIRCDDNVQVGMVIKGKSCKPKRETYSFAFIHERFKGVLW